MAPGNQAITGGTVLRIPAIQSPNYVPGTSGWIINLDGTAEFNSGTFRGSIVVGPTSGAHFIVNNTATGDVIDVYNGSNQLVFSIDAAGNCTSFSPGSIGDPYTRFRNGQQEFNNASGFTTIDPPTISCPINTVNSTELQLYGGSPDGNSHTAVLRLFGGTSAAGSEARITQRDVTGDVLQLDSSNNNSQLVHVGQYSGNVAGGDGHWIFNHGCSFTPLYAILTPWDAQNGDGIFQYMLWNGPFPNSSQCRVVTRTPSGGVPADGTLVGVHAAFFG
jgi:hypothetical protein